VPFLGRPTFIQSPVNWDVTLYTRSIDVHTGLQLDIEAQCDSETGPSDLITGCRGDLEVLGLGDAAGLIH
jgi:hypothetical protein